MKPSIKDKIKANSKIKNFILFFLTPKLNPRPRLWVRIFLLPFIIKKGKGTIIRHNTRIDIFPWNKCTIGKKSTIESFATINNGVGNIVIGNETRIGIGNTIIGPVTIGNQVILAQNVIISGLNHAYQNVTIPIKDQPVTTSQITIEDETWIGANVAITAGVKIGKHSVIAAGSVVTKDIPPYSVAVGNPAKIIKRYDFDRNDWMRNVAN